MNPLNSATHRYGAPLRRTLTALLLLLVALPAAAQEGRTLTFTDLMQIRQVAQPSISADGRWIAFTAEPDRGDPEVRVQHTADGREHTVALGSHPVFSADGAWVAMRLNPSLEARETAERDQAPRRGMVLLETASGETRTFDEVEAFAFSSDGSVLAFHHYAPREENGGGGNDDAGGAGDEADQEAEEEGTRRTLVIHRLGGASTEVADVHSFALHPDGPWLAYAVDAGNDGRDGLYARELAGATGDEITVHAEPSGHYTSLAWAPEAEELAFVHSRRDDEDRPGPGSVMRWEGDDAAVLVRSDQAPEGWFIPADADLRWSEEEDRLFFGWRPLLEEEAERMAASGPDEEEAPAGEPAEEGEEEDFDPYDLEAILDDRGVDVWHYRDEYIMPQQKVMWPRASTRTFQAVHHLDDGRTVALADRDLPDVLVPEGDVDVALARSDVPYRVEATWIGGQRDIYVVGLEDGARTRVAERLRGSSELSPDGLFVVYWDEGNYHLYDVAGRTTRNLTAGLPVPVADEDHDYPDPAPGYGVAGWMEDDQAVLIYDKYDIWVIPTRGGAPWSLTAGEGRRESRVFRLLDLTPDQETIGDDETLLLSSYHDLRKNFGFYRARADTPGVTRLLEEDRRFRFVAQAEEAETILFTREAYDEFPDLWVAGADFASPRKLTDVNPQIAEFAWGSAELVEWMSLDGVPHQGVVIKPGNYREGERYPVLVYYYRFFSQRLHEFNDPSVNHRPSFPIYASDGYVVFLPDVRFEVGRPGFSATKSVVPGVQKLIEMGIADPDAVALHGHSWSGYQTAQVVTQTNLFATAVAGAPVANMTSAYSGIRLGSGVARQFQYEQGQSRLSGSLWEARDEYIDNSPLFFVDRIQTPMLILHGDADDAVPWEQAIELHLAMRRLGKESVLLQYRDEPHHPQTYANKLDWAMKMKEWIDHFTKGTPAPAWITEGVAYKGR